MGATSPTVTEYPAHLLNAKPETKRPRELTNPDYQAWLDSLTPAQMEYFSTYIDVEAAAST